MTDMLFEPYRLGDIWLSNRVVMAPMTRSRSRDHAPGASMAIYYAQRASAGLIITEGAVVSPQGRGYLWTPGIHTAEQVAGWRMVTQAVHAQGGKIFAQLWHVGRMSHVTLQGNGELPGSSAPSRVTTEKVFAYDDEGNPAQLPASPARELTIGEIEGITGDFRRAARQAIDAGFDGVELHAANGYLFDQFINGALNTRDDRYGGAGIENRLRFTLETLDAMIAEIGRERIGVRISPGARVNDCPAFNTMRETFVALAKHFDERRVAYLHVNNGTDSGDIATELRNIFSGALILCGGYTQERARRAVEQGYADLIAFGRPYIGNPDLVERMAHHWPIIDAPKDSYYGGANEGYIDWPMYAQD